MPGILSKPRAARAGRRVDAANFDPLEPQSIAEVLFVVATPIGNLADLSPRAAETLASVDIVAAEDTRRVRQLLSHLGIGCTVLSYHDHSDPARGQALLHEMRRGRRVALVSDAGTPLVSDPGYRLVRAAREHGIQVVPVPGPCAAIAALSIAGLPSDRFVFEGFLAARRSARRTRLEELRSEPRTLIFYESPRRILETLADLVEIFGGSREAVIARELTKLHETVLGAALSDLLARVDSDPEQQLGEIVLVVRGAPAEAAASAGATEGARVLGVLMRHLPTRAAVACAAEISGRSRNELYRIALAARSGEDPQ